jgi:hypothetical protein
MTQGRKAIVRRDPSRCGAYDSSGGFAANVPCARPLGRRFFLEIDALAFIQLVEAPLDRAAVKKPLLPAIITNESESPVPHKSLDDATRHPSLLGLANAPEETSNINFRSTLVSDECS